MNKINMKNAIKRLSQYLKSKDIELPHSRVMDAVAIAMGYKDYPDYAAKTSDPSNVENMRSKTLIIRHHENVRGQDILNKMMEEFEAYFKRAKPIISKNHPDSFPIPEYKEFQKNRTIITWEPHGGHFPENSSVQVLLVFLFPVLKKKYPNIFNYITDIKYLEKKVLVEDMNAIISL